MSSNLEPPSEVPSWQLVVRTNNSVGNVAEQSDTSSSDGGVSISWESHFLGQTEFVSPSPDAISDLEQSINTLGSDDANDAMAVTLVAGPSDTNTDCKNDENVELARGIRLRNGQSRDIESEELKSPLAPSKSQSATLLDELGPITRDFKIMSKHRATMSYHWLRFREHFEYVKQDRNDVAHIIAMLQQQLQSSDNGPAGLDITRFTELCRILKLRTEDVVQMEAKLEAIQDVMVEEERYLRASEDKLKAHFHDDSSSDELDIFDNIVLHTNSSPGHSSTYSEPARPGDDSDDIVMADNVIALDMRLPVSILDASDDNESVISISRTRDRIDMKPLREGEVNEEEDFLALDGVQFAQVKEGIDLEESTSYSAIRFDLEDVDVHVREKRNWDLSPVMDATESKSNLGTLLTLNDPTSTWFQKDPDMINLASRIFRRSWLEFSRFLYWLEDHAGYRDFAISKNWKKIDDAIGRFLFRSYSSNSLPLLQTLPYYKKSCTSTCTLRVSETKPKTSNHEIFVIGDTDEETSVNNAILVRETIPEPPSSTMAKSMTFPSSSASAAADTRRHRSKSLTDIHHTDVAVAGIVESLHSSHFGSPLYSSVGIG